VGESIEREKEENFEIWWLSGVDNVEIFLY